MKIKNYIVLILVALFSFGCQKEEEEVIVNPKDNLTSTSSVTKLLSRVSQYPTSKDNVLDKTSCFSVQLPVTITVNGDVINVANSDDYESVQDEIDEYTTDDDIVHFTYPITLKYKNYQTKVVSSESEYNQIFNSCPPEDGFNEIECANINYPIVLNIYDSENQFANALTITNDAALFSFIANLQSNVYYAVNYPISIVNSDSETITITDNIKLEDNIQDSIGTCTTPNPSNSFTDILNSGSWHVSYCEYDDQDKTSYYSGYNFTFYGSGTIHVVKNSNNYYGNWSTYNDDDHVKLVLDFTGSVLYELEDDWRVTEYTTTEIRLKNDSSGSGGSDYLYFKKN